MSAWWDISVDLYRPPLGEARTWLLIAIVAAVLVWTFVLHRRGPHAAVNWPWRVLLLTMELTALGLLAWVLLGPSIDAGVVTSRQPIPLVILADSSASMAEQDVRLPGQSQPVSRWQAIAPWIEPAFLGQLQRVARVQLYRFDERLNALTEQQVQTLTPEGSATRMFQSIAGVMRSRSDTDEMTDPESGVVLVLGDGHDTRSTSDAALASQLRRQGWRVLAVPVGSTQAYRDIAVMAWADADHLMQNQSTTLHASVLHTGYEGQTVQVDLLHEGRLIDSRSVELRDTRSSAVRFTISPELRAGEIRSIQGYEVVVEPQVDERVTENNRRWVFVQTSKDRLKIAMFEAEPYWDSKFLSRVLREDARIDLTSFYSLGGERFISVRSDGDQPEQQRDFHPAAMTHKDLEAYDVIILGRGIERFFPAERSQMLVDYVTFRGGALIFARGRAFTTGTHDGAVAADIVETIEPVVWGRRVVQQLGLRVTPEGRSSPLLEFEQVGDADTIVTRLPDMLAATTIEREKAASLVLLRQKSRRDDGTPSMAAVAHQYVGQGRVLAVLTDGMWRWAFLPGRLSEYDSVYHYFWSNAIYWIAAGGEFLPGQSVSMSLSRLSVEPGGEISVNVSSRHVNDEDFQPVLNVTDPRGQTRTVTLTRSSEQSSRYVGSIRPDITGVHQVTLNSDAMDETLTARLAVYDESQEKVDPSARPQTLIELALATGGRCFELDEQSAMLSYLDEIRESRQANQSVDDAFNQVEIFALIAALMGLQWFIRRRLGLL